MRIYIVIPLFNEEKYVLDVLDGVQKYGLPVVVVDDGSTDGSKLKVQTSKLKGLTLLEHKINLGKGAAMKTGAEFAFGNGAEAVIFMDSDSQHNPNDLVKFVDALQEKKMWRSFWVKKLEFGSSAGSLPGE